MIGGMKIKFSRHAKRRAKLYKIPESVVEKILAEATLGVGKQEIVRDIPRFSCPIKIVANIENSTVTVVTTYPLKAGVKR